MKEKAFLISLSSGELWHSLTYHSKKLRINYIRKFKNIELITWSKDTSGQSRFELKKHFENVKKVKIICIDPQIQIDELINLVNYFQIKEVTLIIHVYGDFVRQIPFIKKAFNKNKSKISMLLNVPSERIQSAYQELFNTKYGIKRVPILFENLPKRNAHLSLLEFCKSRYKVGYIGRIEQSKNIIETILLLEEANYFESGEFFLAGELDLYNYHYSLKHKENDFLLNLTSCINSLSLKSKSKIHFLGHLEPDELAVFCQKIDLVINLSTFYGECFGISIRQAINKGKPLLLTNWGGFSDLSKHKNVKFLEIDISKKNKSRFIQSQFTTLLYMLLNSKKMKLKKISPIKKLSFSKESFLLKKIIVPSEKKWNFLMSKID